MLREPLYGHLRNVRRNLLVQRFEFVQVAISQSLCITTWASPMPLQHFLTQAIKISQDRVAVGAPHHLTVRFEEPTNAVRPLAKGPRLPRFDENLTEKEVPNGSVEEREDRSMVGPKEPFLGDDRARFAVSLIHMPVLVPRYSSIRFAKDGT